MQNASSQQPQDSAAPPGLRILLVEDDETLAFMVRYLLEREGFHVVSAADGHQASRLVEEGPPFDLVLLDIMLPYHDGFQLIGLIRGTERWRDVPIIMLTGSSMERDIERALDSGADDYIIKPFKPRELLARLRRALRTVG